MERIVRVPTRYAHRQREMLYETHDTREQLATGIRHMLSQKSLGSIDSISVQNIIDEAHVSRPTFYKYFRDKYDLINWVFNAKAEAVFREVYLKTNKEDPFKGVLRIIHDNPAFYANAICTDLPNGFPEYLYLYFCANFTRLVLKKWDIVDYPAVSFMRNNFTDQDSETVFAITYNARGCAYGIVNWIKEDYKTSIDELSGFMRSNISLSLRNLILEFNI